MSRSSNKNAQLSKNVLEMKFMKRTKEKYEKDLFEAEQKALFSTSVTQEMENKRAKKKRFIQENSFVPCADLVSGRMSFKGRNPWIEDEREQPSGEDRGSMGGIQDEEFAERYSSTVDTMSKKFLRKRDRPNDEASPKNKKFKKPRLND
ncbi:M-phase phosphoprotein 6 isoform X2 [Galendromus occidentalis]|uniref:M-phase phosphoprotein 6 isoform X2 n=1 Tax=Galendromus occidentalis TaxID=34638 RepID=A0AAJ7L7L3_9ACAR|nr:M-phase phosphoprotein 6 isoform X2 [Galendromus occidentalis]